MNVFLTLLGTALIVAGLRDIFEQLFRPRGAA